MPFVVEIMNEERTTQPVGTSLVAPALCFYI